MTQWSNDPGCQQGPGRSRQEPGERRKRMVTGKVGGRGLLQGVERDASQLCTASHVVRLLRPELNARRSLRNARDHGRRRVGATERMGAAGRQEEGQRIGPMPTWHQRSLVVMGWASNAGAMGKRMTRPLYFTGKTATVRHNQGMRGWREASYTWTRGKPIVIQNTEEAIKLQVSLHGVPAYRWAKESGGMELSPKGRDGRGWTTTIGAIPSASSHGHRIELNRALGRRCFR